MNSITTIIPEYDIDGNVRTYSVRLFSIMDDHEELDAIIGAYVPDAPPPSAEWRVPMVAPKPTDWLLSE